MLQGELPGVRVTLRLLDIGYINDYIAMFSPRVQHMLHVRDSASECTYVHDCLVRVQQEQTLFYCVFDNHDGVLIGAVEIRHMQSRGQLYGWIHENYWGGGRYQEALSLISREYFRYFKALFFNAHVDVANERSYHALKKFGCAHAGFCHGPHGKQYKLIIRKRS